MTVRPGWFKKAIGTSTPIHTTDRDIVSLRVLLTAPLRQQEERITLDFTEQSTIYTDVRRPMMPQRSGGLENSKFLYQTRQTPFTKQKHRTHNLQTQRFNGVHFKKTQGYLQQPF